MRVSVLDFRKVIYKGDAKRVVLPCEDGQMGVLSFHQPFVCSLKAGSLLISKEWKDRPKEIPIEKGIAKMKDNSLVVLVGEK